MIDLWNNVNKKKISPKEINTVKKILTPKQRLQRLPRALTQVKAGYTSETFLNEIK